MNLQKNPKNIKYRIDTCRSNYFNTFQIMENSPIGLIMKPSLSLLYPSKSHIVK